MSGCGRTHLALGIRGQSDRILPERERRRADGHQKRYVAGQRLVNRGAASTQTRRAPPVQVQQVQQRRAGTGARGLPPAGRGQLWNGPAVPLLDGEWAGG